MRSKLPTLEAALCRLDSIAEYLEDKVRYSLEAEYAGVQLRDALNDLKGILKNARKTHNPTVD